MFECFVHVMMFCTCFDAKKKTSPKSFTGLTPSTFAKQLIMPVGFVVEGTLLVLFFMFLSCALFHIKEIHGQSHMMCD